MRKKPTNKYIVPIVFIMTLFYGGSVFGDLISEDIKNALRTGNIYTLVDLLVRENNKFALIDEESSDRFLTGFIFQKFSYEINRYQMLQDIANNNVSNYSFNLTALHEMIAILEEIGSNNRFSLLMLTWFRSIKERKERRQSMWIYILTQVEINRFAAPFAIAVIRQQDIGDIQGDLADIIASIIGLYLPGSSRE